MSSREPRIPVKLRGSLNSTIPILGKERLIRVWPHACNYVHSPR